MTKRFVMPEFDSEQELVGFYKELCFSLYSTVPSMLSRQIGPEWSLIFKIDCDLARKKTGSIDSAIAAYMNPNAVGNRLRAARFAMEAEVREAGQVEEPKPSRRRRTNSNDLMRRYGSDSAEAREWIEQNREKLDEAEEFNHDDYQDSALSKSRSLGMDEPLPNAHSVATTWHPELDSVQNSRRTSAINT